MRLGVRSAAGLAAAVIVLASCGQVPAATTGPGSQVPQVSAAPVPSGLTAPSLTSNDQATAVDAAQAEVDDVHQLDKDAGIAALIGPGGPTVLANVDAAKVEYGEKTLPEIAAELGIPLSVAGSHVADVRQVRGDRPDARADAPTQWTGSVLGEISATATMVMALMPLAIDNLAGSDQSGTETPIDKAETYTPPPHDGMTESVTITTKVTVSVGGGKVSLDLDITSVDTLTDQASGKQAAQLTGTAHGHIDVNACPDANGVAEGSYELLLKEELVRAGQAAAGSMKDVKAPFRLIDGDDANLVRIEGDLQIDKQAHGPGTAGGDPAGPFDWTVSATIPESIAPSGAVTLNGGTWKSDGNATQDQIDGTVNGRRSAESYLQQIAKETEKFWRSGKCIDLQTSDDTRNVDPNEAIHLTVDATGHFDGQPIDGPIKAAFSGKASLQPDSAQPPAAPFDFTAGGDQGDVGTIDLKQTSKRGIGKKEVVFTVGSLGPFDVTVDAVEIATSSSWTQRTTIKGSAVVRATQDINLQGVGSMATSFRNQLIPDVGECTVSSGQKRENIAVTVQPTGTGTVRVSLNDGGGNPSYAVPHSGPCSKLWDLQVSVGAAAVGFSCETTPDMGPTSCTDPAPAGYTYKITVNVTTIKP